MIKILVLFGVLFLPFSVMAQDVHADDHPEDAAAFEQLMEFLPFEHFNEGHWFSVVLSVLLWLSLFYAVYSLISKIIKSIP